MKLRRLDTAAADFEAEFQRVQHWSAETDAAIETRVAGILADVRARGDAAVLEYTARFDGLQVQGIVVNQFQPRANLPQRLVQELIDEGLPVLQPYLSASVKIRESHELARPMIHLDPRHKLTLEFVALHDALPG